MEKTLFMNMKLSNQIKKKVLFFLFFYLYLLFYFYFFFVVFEDFLYFISIRFLFFILWVWVLHYFHFFPSLIPFSTNKWNNTVFQTVFSFNSSSYIVLFFFAVIRLHFDFFCDVVVRCSLCEVKIHVLLYLVCILTGETATKN